MKKSLTRILTFGGVILLAMTSCKKNDALVTTNGGTPGTLTASSTTPTLDRTKVNDNTTIVTFTTTPPKYSFAAAVTNTIQIDVDGDNWKAPTSIALGLKSYTQSYNTAAFNNMLLKMNLPAGQASKINVRIQYALSATEVTYSNTVAMTVTPFNLSAWVYIVGAFQGWSTSAADSLESVTGNNIYTGVIYFPPNSGGAGQNQFLVLPAKSFSTKWATTAGADTTGNTTFTYASESVTSGGNNFVVPTKGGYYIVTLNNVANTLTITPCDYYSVTGNEVVGGDWGVDQFMKYVNDGSNTWTSTLNYAPVSGGGFKIREDSDWGNSWGTPNAGSAGAGQTGVLVSDKDSNLGVTTAGKYTLTFIQAPSVRTNGTAITGPTTNGPPTIVAPYTFNGK